MATASYVVIVISLTALIAAMMLSLVRLARGPSVLDRAVALDVVTAAVIAVVIVLIAWQKRTDLMVLPLVFALTAFFSTATVARVGIAPAIRRMRKKELRKAERAAELAAEDAVAEVVNSVETDTDTGPGEPQARTNDPTAKDPEV